MNRIKHWIVRKYLPAAARASLEEEIERLERKAQQQAVELLQKRAYINGLHEGQRAARRIVIFNKPT